MTGQPDPSIAPNRLDALREFAGRAAPSREAGTAPIDAAAAEVIAAFAAVGIEVLLLKGRALAELLYEADERRAYSDADLLVAPAQHGVAEAQLARLGYVNAEALQGAEDIGGAMPADTWIRREPRPVALPMIDLHRRLPGAQADPESAWTALAQRTQLITVGGRQVAALDRGGQAMHLAMHAAQHGPHVSKHLLELNLALERWPEDVWNSAADLARQIGGMDAFASGLRLVPEGAAEADRLALPATSQADWTIRNRSGRPRGTFHLRALTEAHGLKERWHVVRRSLLPKRAWIIYEHPWAAAGPGRLLTAYALHLGRLPVWALRALYFRRQETRSGRIG